MKKLLLLSLTIVVLAGCGSNGYDTNMTETTTISSYKELVEGKMFYISHEKNTPDLPANFERLFKDYPNLELVDVEIDSTDGSQYNDVNGYFIFTKEKE